MAIRPSSGNTPAATARGGANNFDFLRFCFASLVIFSHSYPLATGTEALEPLLLLSHGQITLGTLSVDCFFIISGYLISKSWVGRPDVRAYLAKRICRIYPGFLVASVVCAFVLVPLFPAPATRAAFTSDYLARFVRNVLQLRFVQAGGAFPGNPAAGAVNGSLWSIPFEFWCYVGLMCVGLLGCLRRPIFLCIGLACVSLTGFFVELFDMKIGARILGTIFGYPTFWAHVLPYFVSGMAFFALEGTVQPSGRGAVVMLATIGVGCIIPMRSRSSCLSRRRTSCCGSPTSLAVGSADSRDMAISPTGSICTRSPSSR